LNSPSNPDVNEENFMADHNVSLSSPLPESVFRLQNASFTVPGRTLLAPLSLTFPQGKVCGLIGHNGSGKSTLLKMLGRHQPASSGQVLLNETPLLQWDNKTFARQVAYLPQQLPAAEGMTVQELVAIGRYPWHGALGRFKHQDKEKVEEAFCASSGRQPLWWRTPARMAGDDGGAGQPLFAARRTDFRARHRPSG
jgi:iron complex transport system ATP-binding protein